MSKAMIKVQRSGTTGSLFEPLRFEDEDPWVWRVFIGDVEIGVIRPDDFGVPYYIAMMPDVRLNQGDITVIAYEMDYMRDCINR